MFAAELVVLHRCCLCLGLHNNVNLNMSMPVSLMWTFLKQSVSEQTSYIFEVGNINL